MDKIWYRKSFVADEKTECPHRTDKSQTLKKTKKPKQNSL